MDIKDFSYLKESTERTQKIRKELFEEIENDEDFHNFLLSNGLNDELIFKNVGSLIELKREKDTCKNCKGIKDCKLEQKYLNKNLIFDGEMIDFSIGYCQKYGRYLNFKNRVLIDDLNVDYFDKGLKSIKNSAVRQDFLKTYANLLSNKSLKNNLFYLKSKPRSGVTYITNVLFTSYLMKHNVYGIYANSANRIKELNDLYFNNKELFEATMKLYKDVDFLVLNKISFAYINDFIRDNIILPILEYRNSKNKITFVTSELTIDEFGKLLEGKNEQGKIRAKQITSILKSFNYFDISSELGYID